LEVGLAKSLDVTGKQSKQLCRSQLGISLKDEHLLTYNKQAHPVLK